MKNFQRLARLLPLAAAMAALPAFATNGYFPHGYGLKAKGMGGVSTALAQDSMGGATITLAMTESSSGAASAAPTRAWMTAGVAGWISIPPTTVSSRWRRNRKRDW